MLRSLLVINIFNYYRSSNATYLDPDINTGLNSIGLGNLVHSKSWIDGYVDHSYAPIPRPIAPVFLTSLKFVDNLRVVECDPCSPDVRGRYPSPPSAVLTSLPGFKNLYQVNRLVVANTLFKDLESFASLTCTTDRLEFDGNGELTSFDGLERLSTPGSPTVQLFAPDSGPFSTAESIAPIKVFAGCYGGGTSMGSEVNIPVGCGHALTTWQDVCSFMGSPSPCPPG
jgi:hypothetical protein